ncbi:glycosyl hydrolase [Persicobacter diffluens]|uniref:Glycosyl hydrolase n=2 Tax=Persicobacter diffluens TaxID=981 RepID=A0AAN4W3W3_9BACT|nr:glycosyl hydrolase [Persicobacter diffluens]
MAASGDVPGQGWLNPLLPIPERVALLLEAMTLEEKIQQMGNNAPAIDRLGIKEYNWWNECLHGVARNGRATVFPQAIGMAATFDEALIYEVSSAIGKEARIKFNIAQQLGNYAQYSGLTFWTPNVNIFRDPRWGRGQETYGEDPFLTSRMGVNFVKGLQGDDPRYLQAAACAKHFAVHSGPEKLRHEFDAVCSKQDLYETYLPAFKALVTEANVESVMGAYNRVYGIPACGSEFLLQEVLREDWNFQGHVVSDCGAIEDFHAHHQVTPNPIASAAMALKAGTDLNCGGVYGTHLLTAVEQGLVSEDLVDERLGKLLTTKFKLGFFDPVETLPFNSLDESLVGGEAHTELAYQMAAKSLVLLKNDNQVLPLSTDIKNLYVVGPNATSSEVLLGNYFGLAGRTYNILDGIVSNVSLGTTINYKQGVLMDHPNANPIDWSTGEAKAADACIAVMGISPAMEGEEGEAIASAALGDRPDLGLPQHQVEYLKTIKEGSDNPLIVVLTGGSPFVLPEIAEIADAIIMAWYPGQEGGRAVGDMIFGKFSPSGKLPITFPQSISQLPAYEDYSMKGRTYRYMEEAPLYPFGYGLSYTNFEILDLQLSHKKLKKGAPLRATATLRNSGNFDAENVLQLYISGYQVPFEAPNYSLKGFERIYLKAGEEKTIDFELEADDLSLYNAAGELVQPKGALTITVADQSPHLGKFQQGINALSTQVIIK